MVGIGYPVDEEWEIRRLLDLTPSVSVQDPMGQPVPGKTGGADVFLRVIEEEIKPFVVARYKVDATNQTLYGYSLGGLLATRALFRHSQTFSTFIIVSPSLWYNNRAVLADEEAFSKRARAGELHLRILLTSAGDEQYRGDDAKLLANPRNAAYRMVDNAGNSPAGSPASIPRMSV